MKQKLMVEEVRGKYKIGIIESFFKVIKDIQFYMEIQEEYKRQKF